MMKYYAFGPAVTNIDDQSWLSRQIIKIRGSYMSYTPYGDDTVYFGYFVGDTFYYERSQTLEEWRQQCHTK